MLLHILNSGDENERQFHAATCGDDITALAPLLRLFNCFQNLLSICLPCKSKQDQLTNCITSNAYIYIHTYRSIIPTSETKRGVRHEQSLTAACNQDEAISYKITQNY